MPPGSSSTSRVFFQKDGRSSVPVSSNLVPSFTDMNCGVPTSAANSLGPSIGGSSLVTDSNSPLSGGSQLQRSGSTNNEANMRFPASPMSFSSNDISGSTIVQQNPHQQESKTQLAGLEGDGSIHALKRARTDTMQDTNLLAPQEGDGSFHAQKRARNDMRQDAVLQENTIRQLLQRQDSVQLQGHANPQQVPTMQQHRRQQQQQGQQQQLQQCLPQMQEAHLHQNAMPPAVPMKRPSESGVCARKIMQYLYHQRNRPSDNSITYWRKFVAEYFAPGATQRWCIAMYNNGNNPGGFPRPSSLDAWRCEVCGSTSGKAFEASYEALPRLNQIRFDSGIVDEILFLDSPREYQLSSGVMVLDHAKVVQETVYEELRVIHEGHLRITFTPELKILGWIFCARHHEEYLPRRAIASQVNQLLQAVQKYQTAASEAGTAGLSPQDLQYSCNMFATAGRQVARILELQFLNDVGFSKRYVRNLQISEVVNSMKSLFDFSLRTEMGPIESLKSYPKLAGGRLQTQKMRETEQLVTSHCLPSGKSMPNKMIATSPGLSNQVASNFTSSGVLNSTQSPMALNNYQNFLKNAKNSNNCAVQPGALCGIPGPNQAPQISLQRSFSPMLMNSSINGLPGFQQQQQNNLQPPLGNQQLQQHANPQLLQGMMTNRYEAQQPLTAPNETGSIAVEAIGGAGSSQAWMNCAPVRSGMGLYCGTASMMPNQTMGSMIGSSNSFNSAVNRPTANGSNQTSRREMAENFHLPELGQHIPQGEWDGQY